MKKQPMTKEAYRSYILTKITVYHETKLRKLASTNSKMCYLNVNVIGLNGRYHPALLGVTDTKGVPKMRAHLKMLCNDMYTYKRKSDYHVVSFV